MSDRYSRLLAEYAAAITWDRVPPEAVHEVKRRILDSIGVAVAGSDQASVAAARTYAMSLREPEGATIWATPNRSNAEAAGFANAVAVRCLDFNDTYLSKEPLHPSDSIPALVALAERYGYSARDLIAAIGIAYEVSVTLCDAASLRTHGWDHVNYLAIGTACGAGNLLRLDAERIEHAIAIAAVPHAAMRQTRAGELSMWKGAAAANAARNAVVATQLARKGMTGPFEPFEGEMGFFRQLLGGERFDEEALRRLADKLPPTRILDTHIKRWPVEYHAQSAVDAALQVASDLADPGRVRSIRIDTFRAAYEIIARDPEKWDPRTRETADHSLPYIVTAALLDGGITVHTFDLERIRDPRTLDLLKNRVTVEEDPDLTTAYPEGIPNRVTVVGDDGEELTSVVTFPRGHARDPMTDEEVVAKYRANVGERLEPEQAERVRRLVWGLDAQPNVRELTAALGVRG